MSSASHAFRGFISLSPSTFYYIPSGRQSERNNGGHVANPDLIVICSWMGASYKNIAKHTAGYQKLFPESPIVLVTTSLSDMICRTKAQYNKTIEQAVAKIASLHQTTDGARAPRILLHLYSNGGAYAATQLADQYRLTPNGNNRPLPLTTMVLDSSPGRASYKRSLAAMMQTMPPNPVVRIIGFMIVHIVIVAEFLLDKVFHQPNMIERLRKSLLDTQRFQDGGSRLYLYSKADQMVWFSDVEDHVAEASKDWKVEAEMFQSSPHAGLILEDADRYWGAVRQAWRLGYQSR
ncbi:hypothetical protein P152DRAFT_202113 [Eremomyces bilateralis CBS 781.70]|uniref:DUF829-domain-containing protein n=1 Tax=Eremomyces bilateralis CBS 781.70 TaxID=1392243 RepID=A0A6G1GDD5_9PEZI|nr:uncharacterized protein P152DRAFT_202113 [Eremomyces bilateralis CBS 781.70]KAF1815920.1 hypothetical protein P152DRAFT_202113 [Eremomyces bilateralis CBS 781.70]